MKTLMYICITAVISKRNSQYKHMTSTQYRKTPGGEQMKKMHSTCKLFK